MIYVVKEIYISVSYVTVLKWTGLTASFFISSICTSEEEVAFLFSMVAVCIGLAREHVVGAERWGYGRLPLPREGLNCRELALRTEGEVVQTQHRSACHAALYYHLRETHTII